MNRIRTYKGAMSRTNLFLSLVLVVFSFAACSGQSRLMNLTSTQPAPPPPTATTSVPGVQASYADLVTRVAPAVVTIRSTERTRAPQPFPFMDDPMFRQFLGYRMPQPQ